MTYTKPEVEVLGNASTLIELGADPKSSVPGDAITSGPAYDLDE